ncbi:MAG: hypothetical protein AB1736_13625 [Chloroflexota bacterium]
MGVGIGRRTKRCGWGSHFTIISCNLPRGHTGPHHIPSDPGMPQSLTRAEQEDHHERMKGRLLGQMPRPKA